MNLSHNSENNTQNEKNVHMATAERMRSFYSSAKEQIRRGLVHANFAPPQDGDLDRTAQRIFAEAERATEFKKIAFEEFVRGLEREFDLSEDTTGVELGEDILQAVLENILPERFIFEQKYGDPNKPSALMVSNE